MHSLNKGKTTLRKSYALHVPESPIEDEREIRIVKEKETSSCVKVVDYMMFHHKTSHYATADEIANFADYTFQFVALT